MKYNRVRVITLVRWVSVVTIALGVCAAAIVAFRRGTSVGEAVPVSEWSVGEARTYGVTVKTRVLTADSPVLEVTVRGSWVLTRLSASAAQKSASATRVSSDDAMLLSAVLEPEDVMLATAPAKSSSLRDALREPVVVSFGSRGVARDIGFVTAPSGPEQDVARGILRSLVATFQFAAPPDESRKDWTAEETDLTGAYEAHYKRSDTRAADREKTRYIRVAATGPIQGKTVIDRASARVEFGNHTLSLASLRQTTADEQTHVEWQGPMPAMSATLGIKIHLDKISNLSVQALAALEGRFRSVPRRALHDRTAETHAALDRAKVVGPPLPDVLAELRALLQSNKPDSARRARLFSRVMNEFRFNESSVPEAVRLIRANDPLRAILLDALANAGSAVAQKAVTDLFRVGSLSMPERHGVLVSLGLNPALSSDTLTFLESLRDDPTHGRQARYTLGAAAGRLLQRDPASGREVSDLLLSDLKSAENPSDTITALTALSGAGDPTTVPDVEPALSDPNPAVRAAALKALRKVPGSRADQDIARLLLADPIATVRQAAAHTMFYRAASPVLVYAVRDSMLKEADRSVRKEAVKVAIRWASGAPVLRQALSVVAASDSDAQIREIASGGNQQALTE